MELEGRPKRDEMSEIAQELGIPRRRFLRRLSMSIVTTAGLAAALTENGEACCCNGCNAGCNQCDGTCDAGCDNCDDHICDQGNVCNDVNTCATNVCMDGHECTGTNVDTCTPTGNSCAGGNTCSVNTCGFNSCQAGGDACGVNTCEEVNTCVVNTCTEDDWCSANTCSQADTDCGLLDISCPVFNGCSQLG